MKRSRAVVVGLLALALCATTTAATTTAAASAGSLGSDPDPAEPTPKVVSCTAVPAGTEGNPPAGTPRLGEAVTVTTKDGKTTVTVNGEEVPLAKAAPTAVASTRSGDPAAGEPTPAEPLRVRRTKDGKIEITTLSGELVAGVKLSPTEAPGEQDPDFAPASGEGVAPEELGEDVVVHKSKGGENEIEAPDGSGTKLAPTHTVGKAEGKLPATACTTNK